MTIENATEKTEEKRGLECRHCRCRDFRVVYTRRGWAVSSSAGGSVGIAENARQRGSDRWGREQRAATEAQPPRPAQAGASQALYLGLMQRQCALSKARMTLRPTEDVIHSPKRPRDVVGTSKSRSSS